MGSLRFSPSHAELACLRRQAFSLSCAARTISKSEKDMWRSELRHSPTYRAAGRSAPTQAQNEPVSPDAPFGISRPCHETFSVAADNRHEKIYGRGGPQDRPFCSPGKSAQRVPRRGATMTVGGSNRCESISASAMRVPRLEPMSYKSPFCRDGS